METIITRDYPIFFENIFEEINRFIQKNSYSKIFILVDINTSEHCLPILNFNLESLQKYDIIEVDAGEENKNIDIAIGVWRTLLDFEADKNSLLINLGGGMISDLGGYCAASFMRGIDFINIPTSLLAMVDASVGGKTAIDLEHYKNIIGFFAFPKAVFIDDVFLKTLTQRELYSGWAEIIKHGLIADKKYFDDFFKSIDAKDISYSKFIYKSVQIKNKIVEQDPKDKSIRKLLNFGHTIGHAIESFALQYPDKSLLHGEAVFLGMLAESFISYRLGILNEEKFKEIENKLKSLLPPIPFTRGDFETLLNYLKMDKKNKDGKLLFVLLHEIGVAQYDQEIEKELVIEAFKYLINEK